MRSKWNRRRCRFRESTSSCEDCSDAVQDAVEAAAYFLEVFGVAAGQFYSGGSAIVDVRERLVYGFPVDLAFEQRHVFRHALLDGRVEPVGPVLDVHLHDPLANRTDPVLRIGVAHDVADVEVRANPRAFEFVHVTGELERAEQEFVPDFLHADHDLQVRRHGDQQADLALAPLPGLGIGGLRIHHRGYQEYGVGAPKLGVAEAGAHALHALLDHRWVSGRQGTAPMFRVHHRVDAETALFRCG